MLLTCEHCHRIYKSRSSVRRFCSRKCYLDSKVESCTKECLICGKRFSPDTKSSRYCSQSCFHKSRVLWHSKTCSYCSQPFNTKDIHQQFCSKACSYKGRKPPSQKIRPHRKTPPREQKACPVCGKEFLSVKGQRYCSKECFYRARQNRSTCQRCSKVFYAAKYLHKKFCSFECFLNRSNIETAPLTEQYDAGKSTMELSREYGLTPGAIAERLHKAGVEMRPGWLHLVTNNPTRGKGHTKASKDKLRESALRQFASPTARQLASENQIKAMTEGRISRISGLEEDVAKALDELGIAYDRQVGIRNPANGRFCACVDFCLSDNKVLEVNGTYWHADPRVYPNGPEFPSQKQTVERYKKKIASLQSLGITIIELWELDLRKAPIPSLLKVLKVNRPVLASRQLNLPISE